MKMPPRKEGGMTKDESDQLVALVPNICSYLARCVSEDGNDSGKDITVKITMSAHSENGKVWGFNMRVSGEHIVCFEPVEFEQGDLSIESVRARVAPRPHITEDGNVIASVDIAHDDT